MDGMPQPVDLGALSGLLARSRQVMNKLEDTAPIKSRGGQVAESYDNSYSNVGYDESDEREPLYEQIQQHQGQGQTQQPAVLGPIDYNEDIVRNSKLPQNIKDLMIAHPIKQLTSPPSRFTAEEISKITGAPIRQPQPQQPQRISENIQQPQRQGSDMITISKADLKEMINEGISTFFKQVYDKTLTEETIKKTINLLIKEGKIGVKKKV